MRQLRLLLGTAVLALLPGAAIHNAYAGQWTGTPLPVAATGSDEVLLDASGDGAYGLIVTWGVGSEVRAQHVDPTGGTRWDSLGIPIASTGLATREAGAGFGTSAIGTRGHDQFVTWTDTLGAGTGQRVYLMRLLPGTTALGLTGTLDVDGTVASPDKTLVTGTAGTQFLSEVRPSEFIQIGGDGQWVKVAAVTANTTLYLEDDYPIDAAPSSGAGLLLRAYAPLTGALTFDGTVNVTGLQTYFNTEVVAGDFIRLDSFPNTWMKVASVTDDTALTLEVASPVSGTDEAGSVSESVVFKTAITPADQDCRNPQVMGVSSGAYVVCENWTLGATAGAGPPSDTNTTPLLQLSFVSDYGDVWWTTDIWTIHPTDGDVRLFSDGGDGIILVFNHPVTVSDPIAGASTMRATRINSLGDAVWPSAPYNIWYRPPLIAPLDKMRNMASVAPDGQGGLWVAARYPVADAPPTTEDPRDDDFSAAYHRLVDGNGEYVHVNHVQPDGTWEWNPWVQTLQWDAHEKSNRLIPLVT